MSTCWGIYIEVRESHSYLHFFVLFFLAHDYAEDQWFLNRSIWLIDWTITSTTTQRSSGPGSNANESYSMLPRSLKLELHDQIPFTVILKTPFFVEEGLTPL